MFFRVTIGLIGHSFLPELMGGPRKKARFRNAPLAHSALGLHLRALPRLFGSYNAQLADQLLQLHVRRTFAREQDLN